MSSCIQKKIKSSQVARLPVDTGKKKPVTVSATKTVTPTTATTTTNTNTTTLATITKQVKPASGQKRRREDYETIVSAPMPPPKRSRKADPEEDRIPRVLGKGWILSTSTGTLVPSETDRRIIRDALEAQPSRVPREAGKSGALKTTTTKKKKKKQKNVFKNKTLNKILLR